MTTSYVKNICDRCGEFEEYDTVKYNKDWQLLTLGQTGAHLDLCTRCNAELVAFLSLKGAGNMKAACINKREVI